VVSAAFSFDDQWAATGGMDGTVKVVNVKSREEITLEGPSSEIEWVSWHSSNLVIVAGSTDTTIWMWNVAESGSMLGVFAGHTDSVTCGSFTPNGRRLVSGSLDGSLKLWDPNSASCLHTFSGHGFHEGGILTFTAKSEEPLVATGGSDGTVCLVRLDTKKVVARFPHLEPASDQDESECSIESIAFCQSLPWLISCGTDGRLVIWDLSVQARRSVLVHPDKQAVVKCISIPNSTLVVTASVDAKIRVWDIRASKLERTLLGHREAILDMVLLSSNKHVVTASDDGTCRVFLVN